MKWPERSRKSAKALKGFAAMIAFAFAGAQNAARIPFRLARVGLGGSVPVDTPQCMAAARLDDSVAIDPCLEAWSESDVEGDIRRKRRGRGLEQSGVDNYRNVESGKKEDGV